MKHDRCQHSPQPDRLLTTLEQLLDIDAIEVKPALQQAAQLLGEALAADKVDAFFYDPATHSLLALGVNDSPMSQHERALGLDRIPVANRGRAAEVFLTGDSFLSGHLDQDQGELLGVRTPPPQGLGVVSEIAARIDMRGESRGVLMVSSHLPAFFTEHDLRFLEAAARWIGMVMHRAELVEEQTREAVKQGRRLAAEELLTIMAHDLKNYLTPLKARLDLLRRRAHRQERPEDVRDLEVADATLTRLNRLIGNLLDVARLDQGLFVLQLCPLNIVALLHEAASPLSTPEVSIQVEGPEEVVLQADPDRLRQVFENLLANAVRHAPKHTHVLVNINNEYREDELWVVISIHNQGPAISSDLLTHLFQPFVAGSHSQGLGLGLYLARHIVEAHGGNLAVTSEGTSGTQFTLVMPTEPERTGQQSSLSPSES